VATARRASRHNGTSDSWYRITRAQRPDAGGLDPTYAEVYIYDEIGYWGRTAQDLVDELATLRVDEIDLHLNSPGGELFDGIAIYQAFRDHPATVCVYVDALAASVASVIAMAGDRVVMGRMAQLMIHDAWGLCVGNAGDMRQMADELDRFSDIVAGAYAERAGGTANQWRKAMLAETWYGPAEAVEAGLADAVAPKQDRDEPAAAKFDLSQFRYAGRESAPAPTIAGGTAPASGPGSRPAPGATADTPAEPEPPADPEPLVLPDDLNLAAGIRDATAEPAVLWNADMADVFRAVIEHEATHQPAPTEPPAGLDQPQPLDLAQAVKEALL
jgi:ATP-dependent protease ClpP protease subunit